MAMALEDPAETLRDTTRGSDSLSDGELDKLETDVKQMADKILDYRTTLPDQLKKNFVSILSAQRPVLPELVQVLEAGNLGNPNSNAGEPVESGKGVLVPEDDKDIAEKVRLIRQKISNNASAMPILLKRMNEYISKIDNFKSCNETIHPSFKKKRSS